MLEEQDDSTSSGGRQAEDEVVEAVAAMPSLLSFALVVVEFF